MTLAASTNRNDYTGNGSVDTYAYGFKILDDDHLVVTVRDTDGDETTLVKTTDYTVTGVGESAGGNVVLVDADQAWLDAEGDLKSNYELSIRRVLPLTQVTDIRNQGPRYPSVTEDALDKAVMVAQQLKDELNRSLKTQETDYVASLYLPLTDDRASKFLAFDADGEPIAASGVTEVPVSSFMETLLDDTTAAIARATLGFSGSGGTVAEANMGVNSVATASIQPGAVTRGKFASAAVSGISEITNFGLAASVGSSAMTIAVKTLAGTDPSSSDACYVGIRSATAATGVPSTLSITGALSMSVASGATLGQKSGAAEYVYVYLLSNAGTAELAVSTRRYDDGSIVTTTAMNGSATSATAIYSTNQRSNVPIKLVGRIKSTQAAAGTWATTPSEVALFPHFHTRAYVCALESTAGDAIGDAIEETAAYATDVFDPDSIGASSVVTSPIRGWAQVNASLGWNVQFADADDVFLAVRKNSTNLVRSYYKNVSAGELECQSIAVAHGFMVEPGDTISIRVFQDSGGSKNRSASAISNTFTVRIDPV